MLERLGHVLGWTGNIIALLFIGVGVAFAWDAISRGKTLDDTMPMFVVIGALALIAFLLGRALHYIFAGGKR